MASSLISSTKWMETPRSTDCTGLRMENARSTLRLAPPAHSLKQVISKVAYPKRYFKCRGRRGSGITCGYQMGDLSMCWTAQPPTATIATSGNCHSIRERERRYSHCGD